MAVDSNFERLEQEVGRLVDILGKLRQENVEIKARAETLEAENQQLRTDNEQLEGDNQRLQQVETQFQEANQSREVIRGRIENLLTKLDAVEI
jgi:FtsZ-binding cell division protein ZapB